MSKLLLDEPPLMVLPKLAEKVGLNEAIILQQIHYWLSGKSAKEKDGKYWIYNTYEDWQKQFPFWSVSTVRRTLNSLEKQGLIFKGNYNRAGFDKTIWYSVDYELINRMSRPSVHNDLTSGSKWTDGSGHNDLTNTRDYTEITTENKQADDDDVSKDEKTKEKIAYKEIVEYLNEKSGKDFSYKAKGNKKFIEARWNEGQRLEDFKKVVDVKAKDQYFIDNGYLRPETLFGNKFDNYKNEYKVDIPKKNETGNEWMKIMEEEGL